MQPTRLLLLALYLAVWIWATVDFAKGWMRHGAGETGVAQLVFWLRIAAVGSVALPLSMAVRRMRSRTPLAAVRWGGVLRGLLYCGLLGVVTATIFSATEAGSADRGLLRSAFRGAVCAALAGLACALLRSRDRALPRPLQRVDLVAGNAALVLVLAEGALLAAGWVYPTPLLWTGTAEAYIDAHRLEPGSDYFGFRVNSGGYHDEEFFAREDEDFVACVLADSFGVGVVPYAFNFATIAERELRARLADRPGRVAVHNFGVAAIGPREYAYLLHTEAQATKPSAVAVCVFVGNDIHENETFHSQTRAPQYRLQHWLVWSVPRRLLAMQQEWAAGGLNLPHPDAAATDFDPETETPSFSPERFLQIERRRVAICRTDDPRMDRDYEALFDGLQQFREWLGEQLLVVLIPDEFQVNDALWRELMDTAETPQAYDRDAPQRRIATFCRENGIEVLDALPALRAAEVEGHTYHLRDTHLNARGNRVLGELLAGALAEMARR